MRTIEEFEDIKNRILPREARFARAFPPIYLDHRDDVCLVQKMEMDGHRPRYFWYSLHMTWKKDGSIQSKQIGIGSRPYSSAPIIEVKEFRENGEELIAEFGTGEMPNQEYRVKKSDLGIK